MRKKSNYQFEPAKKSPELWMFAWGNVTRVGGTEQRMTDAIPILESHNIETASIIRDKKHPNGFQRLLRSRTKEITYARSWIEYYKTLLSFKGSVVWTFGFKQSIVARIVKTLHKTSWKLIMPRNGLDYSWKPWMHFVDRITQNKVDLYITNSQKVSEHIQKSGIKKERVAVVLSGLPHHWYENVPTTKNGHFVMVGNNRPEKNQLMGIKAFLHSKIPTTLTVYTDDGTSLNKYLASTDENDRNRVSIIEGHRLTPGDFDSYGILLHPSIRESLPLTVLEAQARRCYVLAADTGDTAQLINETNGLLLDPNSILDMSAKIKAAFDIFSKYGASPSLEARTTYEYIDDILNTIQINERKSLRERPNSDCI